MVRYLLPFESTSEETRMSRPMVRGFAVMFALALIGPACGGSTPVTPTTPTTPVEMFTDTFEGTIAQGASAIHQFSAKAAGTVTATLTAVGPLSTMAIGVDIGVWDGNSCTSVIVNPNAKQSSQLIGTASAPVNLCIKVYDVGNIVDSATYSVMVVHP
jgi:hypothetical protein